MKDTVVMILICLGLLFALILFTDVRAEEKNMQLIMEKFIRVQALYDEGLKLHETGNKYQGCYYLRLAVRESRWIGDDGQTLRQIEPVYEKICNKSVPKPQSGS